MRRGIEDGGRELRNTTSPPRHHTCCAHGYPRRQKRTRRRTRGGVGNAKDSRGYGRGVRLPQKHPPSLFDFSSTCPERPTCPRRHACPAEHHTKILDAGSAGVGNARDERVVEVVSVEWELQQSTPRRRVTWPDSVLDTYSLAKSPMLFPQACNRWKSPVLVIHD
ncbi:hypothetical protein K443DRAFT_285060 [Laccaria amethystina LaAM-08-1]|uniref:Unplaced genomic scaffold K443scaffold_188, whole genome shotgun sequence n=1 Tax=Laccaria amethystina LaAM-08-1 TaxID=1095629 RepID=A0A0C9WVD5_9AGAR|nr:hypothetical protein K443DRAFT_285060 [Laccaria amethystina LaAM-08-1]